jgi:aminoglycoside phosphotransferase (APT) family kinase protein
MSFTEPRRRRIEELLVAHLPGARDASISNLERVFGGNARRAWAFDATWRHGEGSSSVAAILLAQIEPGQVDGDPAREYRVLRALGGSEARVPGALAVDPTGAILGAPAVVLQRMPGSASVTQFLSQADPQLSRELSKDLAVAAAELHACDWRETGLDETAPSADVRACVAAQIAGWRARFETARYEPHPVLDSLFGWLEDHLPEPPALSVVHGDLRPGNFLYQSGRLTALLDWEMAHLGDPAEDLAWAYRPLWSPERFLPIDEFLALYNDRTRYPVGVERLHYYRVFSELKFASISLRGARAFHDGVSSNLRLADRAAMVTECARRALNLVEEPCHA